MLDKIEAANNPILAKKESIADITKSQQESISDIAAASSKNSNADMSEVVTQLKALTTVTAANKDVYVSGKKVTDNVTRLQERSNINQFGLMGA